VIPGGASRRRIASVAASPLDLELTEPFGIATGAQARAHNVLVRVTLDDGTVGLGEGAPFPAVSGETQAGTLEAASVLGRGLVGRDVEQLRPLSEWMAYAKAKEPAARAAIEQALHDALARSAGLPLSALFGGARAPLETDMTITTGDAAHAASSARAIEARGIGIIKLKVGKESPAIDAERLAAVHDAAPTARLLCDANGGWSEAEAIAFAMDVAKRGLPLELFEQPIAAGDLDALARVQAAVDVVVCADESARSAKDVLELASRGAARAVNLKITKTGVLEAIAMWHVARAAGLGLMIGGMVEAELAMTFSAHLASGLGGFTWVDLDTPLFLKDSPFVGGFGLDGGTLVLDASRPGVGVTLR
jgi:L-alanine-DL-glutamate epimerase-like enolase superfamily enzyme